MSTSANNQKLGTFAGVFTPSILTILGLILFLRMGHVLGSAGLGKALLIICLANLISILTSFSLAAIVSNYKVKGGGDYYLISRTLGVEFGGAIGIVLFLAQSISIAFYCIGFGEAMASIVVTEIPFFPQISAALALGGLFLLTWLGADWATKFQYLIMGTLVLALISFFSGALQQWSPSTLVANWYGNPQSSDFWILFAIFFPAVTGFTQGVSMSGDLRGPGKSLPLGTFLAVGLSFLVYLAVAVVFSGALPNDTLARDYHAMKRVASWSFL
ncbi:MAG: amino acid permease, partial [Proteobacteria bacterium]|nr:amino acid permease [Pseudomonadota bacterium]